MQADEKEVWQLHLRKAKGETLSEEELKRVQAWYDELDREEAEQLGLSEETELVRKIQEMQQLIETIKEQNTLLLRQNEKIVLEIAVLREQHEHRPSPTTF